MPVAPLVAIWTLMFAFTLGIRVWIGDGPWTAALPHAVLWASMTTVSAGFSRRGAAMGKPKGDDERSARWRTYDGDRPARWRGGWLHRSGAGAVLIPVTGDTGPRIQPPDVREVRERPAATREKWEYVGERMRVLELDLASGRVDLVVREEDVPTVRRWVGAEDGVAGAAHP